MSPNNRLWRQRHKLTNIDQESISQKISRPVPGAHGHFHKTIHKLFYLIIGFSGGSTEGILKPRKNQGPRDCLKPHGVMDVNCSFEPLGQAYAHF